MDTLPSGPNVSGPNALLAYPGHILDIKDHLAVALQSILTHDSALTAVFFSSYIIHYPSTLYNLLEFHQLEYLAMLDAVQYSRRDCLE